MSSQAIGQRFRVSRGGCWQCGSDCRSRLAEVLTFSKVAYNYLTSGHAIRIEEAWRAGALDVRKECEAELSRLRAERDELVGALEEVVYQVDEGIPITDISPCIVKASKLVSKHKPE